MSLDYTESLEQAAEYGNSALEMMKKNGIAANPNNFTVWYHYFSGQIPDLKRALEILIDNDQDFSEGRNEEIHKKFFTFDHETQAIGDAATRA